MVDQANSANNAAGVQLVMTALLGQTHAVLSSVGKALVDPYHTDTDAW